MCQRASTLKMGLLTLATAEILCPACSTTDTTSIPASSFFSIRASYMIDRGLGLHLPIFMARALTASYQEHVGQYNQSKCFKLVRDAFFSLLDIAQIQQNFRKLTQRGLTDCALGYDNL
jgi:hypothetical protein